MRLWAGAAFALAGCGAVPASEAGDAQRGQGFTLDGAGIQPTGSALRIDFGRAEAGVVAAVARLAGQGPAETAQTIECGGGPAMGLRWPQGFTLVFREGTFLGWIAEGSLRAPVSVAGGLEIGGTAPAAAGAIRAEAAAGRIARLSAGIACP